MKLFMIIPIILFIACLITIFALNYFTVEEVPIERTAIIFLLLASNQCIYWQNKKGE